MASSSSDSNVKQIIYTSLATAGVLSAFYFIYKKFNPGGEDKKTKHGKNLSKDMSITEICSEKKIAGQTDSKNQNNRTFELATSKSNLEITQNTLTISKAENITLENLHKTNYQFSAEKPAHPNDHFEENNNSPQIKLDKQKDYKFDSSHSEMNDSPKRRECGNGHGQGYEKHCPINIKKRSDNKKNEGSDNLTPLTSHAANKKRRESRKESAPLELKELKSGKEYTNDISFTNIMQDLRNIENQNDFFHDQSLLLDPHADLKNTTVKGNIFNSDGYIEEEDDDQFTPEEEDLVGVINELLKTENELKTVLTSNKYQNKKFKINLINVLIEDDKEVTIISEDFILIIFNYLYTELNEVMMEISDDCAEDRRKYFESNFSSYVKTIELYLKKKNEYFSCALSNLFFKLSIKQEDFDNSVNYYINIAEETKSIQHIRETYEKVFEAGRKEIKIIPKILNKKKLKEILTFKLKVFADLEKEHKNEDLNTEVLKIIANDYVYLEYGIEKETISKAIEVYNAREDPSMKEIIEKLEEFHGINHSFLSL